MFKNTFVTEELTLKGQVHCFSTQAIINKLFLLNLEKMEQICLIAYEKNAPLIPKNDFIEPKAKLL